MFQNPYVIALRNTVVTSLLALCLAVYGLSRILPHGVGNIFPSEWDLPLILMYLAGWLVQLALPFVLFVYAITILEEKNRHDISHDAWPMIIWLIIYILAALVPWIYLMTYGSWQTPNTPIVILNYIHVFMILEAVIIFIVSLIIPEKAAPAA